MVFKRLIISLLSVGISLLILIAFELFHLQKAQAFGSSNTQKVVLCDPVDPDVCARIVFNYDEGEETIIRQRLLVGQIEDSYYYRTGDK